MKVFDNPTYSRFFPLINQLFALTIMIRKRGEWGSKNELATVYQEGIATAILGAITTFLGFKVFNGLQDLSQYKRGHAWRPSNLQRVLEDFVESQKNKGKQSEKGFSIKRVLRGKHELQEFAENQSAVSKTGFSLSSVEPIFMKNIKEDEHWVSFVGFVEGELHVDNPFSGTDKNGEKVDFVYSEKQTELVRSFDSIVGHRYFREGNYKRFPGQLPRGNQIKLTDLNISPDQTTSPNKPHRETPPVSHPNEGGNQAHVSLIVDRMPLVDPILLSNEFYVTKAVKKFSLIDRIRIGIGETFLMIGTIFRGVVPYLRGFSVGVASREVVLKVGTTALVFGQFHYNKISKKLYCSGPPAFLADKRDAYFNMVPLVKNTFLLFVSSTLFLFFYQKFSISRRLLQNKKIKEQNQMQISKLARQYAPQEKELCIVCVTRPRQIIYFPCNHFSCCSECHNHLNKKQCPICRKGYSAMKYVVISDQ